MAQILKFNQDGTYRGATVNPKKSLQELKDLKEPAGLIVYEATDQEIAQAKEGYTPSLSNGEVTFVKGWDYDAKIELDNKFIAKEISQILIIKNGKIEAGLPTTEEDAKIANLKAKLM